MKINDASNNSKMSNFDCSHTCTVDTCYLMQHNFNWSDQLAQIRSVTGFMCPNNCGHKYEYKRNLQRHLRYECGIERKFNCIFCGRKFAQKISLKKHLFLIHKLPPDV